MWALRADEGLQRQWARRGGGIDSDSGAQYPMIASFSAVEDPIEGSLPGLVVGPDGPTG